MTSLFFNIYERGRERLNFIDSFGLMGKIHYFKHDVHHSNHDNVYVIICTFYCAFFIKWKMIFSGVYVERLCVLFEFLGKEEK